MAMNRYPCGAPRREFLRTLGRSALGASLLPTLAGKTFGAQRTEPSDFTIPGPFPGRVVEVRHPGMIRADVKDGSAIRSAMARGMRELTGADSPEEAWRYFFEPSDVVGVKVNPVGNPLANTSTEVLHETLAGLRSAGVRPENIIVFDRYRVEFMRAGFHEVLPDGVRWEGLTPQDDPSQLEMAGYDRDEFVSMELVHPNHDPSDDRTRRSHLGLVVTQKVNKIVCLPVLKDHGSGGVTLALKNMSHGFVNNVARSHGGPHHNVCNQFIPEIVMHPIIRRKVVLQILDGVKGVFQGGPFGTKPEWTWERNSMFFATDPVAMDHVGWRIVDAERARHGLPPVGAVGKMGLDADYEAFDMRQPQHIPLAGALGLGVFDLETIDHRQIRL